MSWKQVESVCWHRYCSNRPETESCGATDDEKLKKRHCQRKSFPPPPRAWQVCERVTNVGVKLMWQYFKSTFFIKFISGMYDIQATVVNVSLHITPTWTWLFGLLNAQWLTFVERTPSFHLCTNSSCLLTCVCLIMLRSNLTSPFLSSCFVPHKWD